MVWWRKPVSELKRHFKFRPLTERVTWDGDTAIVEVQSVKGQVQVLMDRRIFEALIAGGWNVSLSRSNAKHKMLPIPQVSRGHKGSLTVYYLRRFVMGRPDGYDVLNRNKNPLDCRFENLTLKPNLKAA
jgi:hypothetical protein